MRNFRDMTAADLDAVLGIEAAVQDYPWTRGKFTGALESGNLCKVLEEAGEILGYAVMLEAPDEMELLTIAIAACHQRKGLGRWLLSRVLEYAREKKMMRVILEVRPSNEAALGLYGREGFAEIGLRRGYYCAHNGGREDAIVMARNM
jgi:ribosomal-protein-alanine acetyltransferase